jgi:hypothetical protein
LAWGCLRLWGVAAGPCAAARGRVVGLLPRAARDAPMRFLASTLQAASRIKVTLPRRAPLPARFFLEAVGQAF